MTKREICERLIAIHNRLFHEYAMADGIEDLDLEAIGKDIGALILDLVAPDEHFADAGKMMREEEKSPLAMKWVAVDKSAPCKPCPKCGAPSTKRIDAPGYYCEPCGAGFEAEEPPVLIYEDIGEKTPCPKCGEPAYQIKNKPGVFHCKRCHGLVCTAKGEPKREEPEAEENHPGVIARPGKDGEIEFCWCQKCYEQAAVVHDPFGDGENWSYCKTCGVSFRLKRGEEEK